jgi:phage gp36-like protein
MTYCTARQYCDQFGLSEAAMLLQDEEHGLTQHMLNATVRDDAVLLADLNNIERATGAAALARLEDALAEMSVLIDGYLRAVITLPLTLEQIATTPLKTCCAELTRCYLMDDSDNVTDTAEKRCEVKRQWLRDVNAGRIKLFADESAASTSAGETRHGVGKTLTNWRGYPYP